MNVERLIGDLRSLRAACRAHNRMPTGAEVCQSAIDALAKLQAENTALKTQRRPAPYRGGFGPGRPAPYRGGFGPGRPAPYRGGFGPG